MPTAKSKAKAKAASKAKAAPRTRGSARARAAAKARAAVRDAHCGYLADLIVHAWADILKDVQRESLKYTLRINPEGDFLVDNKEPAMPSSYLGAYNHKDQIWEWGAHSRIVELEHLKRNCENDPSVPPSVCQALIETFYSSDPFIPRRLAHVVPCLLSIYNPAYHVICFVSDSEVEAPKKRGKKNAQILTGKSHHWRIHKWFELEDEPERTQKAYDYLLTLFGGWALTWAKATKDDAAPARG